MVEAARIAEAAGPELLDLNFGCPVKRVAGKGAGSGMLRCPDQMLRIVKEVVRAVDIPVTVKTRLGWDNESKIIVELAEALQDCGIQALTIHGRTRAQMYTGQADWSLIGAVKANPRMHIPIIGNGDITTGEEARRAFDTYGVDAVMVGRATIGQPWIFEQMKYFLQTGQEPPLRAKAFYVDILRQLVDNNIHKLDERRGILHSRRHIAASPIFKGIDNFRPVRIAMLQATTRETLFHEIARAEELLLSTGTHWS
jgi:putative TIM-barrel protein